jgi:hypothetical protein
MEVVRLAPKAEVTMYPWKEPKDLIPQAVRHVRDFLRAHQPVPCVPSLAVHFYWEPPPPDTFGAVCGGEQIPRPASGLCYTGAP